VAEKFAGFTPIDCGGWPTFTLFVKVGTARVSYRLQKAPVDLYSSLLAGLPPTFARTAKVGQPPRT